MRSTTGHSRIAVLILCVVGTATSCGDQERVALDFSEFGEGYVYASDALARFSGLVRSRDWTLAELPRNPQGMLQAVHTGTGLNFVLVPAGSFLMGSPDELKGRGMEERPAHPVTVPPFLLCTTECTQAAWVRGGESSGAWFEGADRPEDSLSWAQCQEWCARNRLRLPTEAEWEYACRAGTTTVFSTGQTLSTDQANFDGSRSFAGGAPGEYRKRTVASGTLPANPWGLHEVHGNVWEWCGDAWHESYEGAPTDGSAWTTGDDRDDHTIRGGGWPFFKHSCSSATRVGYPSMERMYCLGFRPAADLPP